MNATEMKRDIKDRLEVYFIAGTQDTDDLPIILEQAIEAGITCFQYREKGPGSLEKDPLKMEEMAIRCQSICKKHAIPFIINDNLALAGKVQADGVHVGQGDQSIETVREQLGEEAIVGLSTNTLEQYKEALTKTGIDYVGIGPAFLPQSKADHEQVMGLDKMKEAMAFSKALPAVAIGGITENNAQAVWQTGVDGLAVISTITRSKDVFTTVAALKKR